MLRLQIGHNIETEFVNAVFTQVVRSHLFYVDEFLYIEVRNEVFEFI